MLLLLSCHHSDLSVVFLGLDCRYFFELTMQSKHGTSEKEKLNFFIDFIVKGEEFLS